MRSGLTVGTVSPSIKNEVRYPKTCHQTLLFLEPSLNQCGGSAMSESRWAPSKHEAVPSETPWACLSLQVKARRCVKYVWGFPSGIKALACAAEYPIADQVLLFGRK